MRVLVFLALIFGALWWGNGALKVSGDTTWSQVDDRLEMRTFTLSNGTSRLPVYAWRLAPEHLRLLTGDNLTAAQWLQKSKARLVINGGYFDERSKPLGLRVANRKKVSSLRQANWGVFYIRKNRAAISHTRDYKPSRHTQLAIQCGPRLVVDGRPTDLKPQWGRRTGVGIDRTGRIVLAVADGELGLEQWAKHWASADGLNCRDALNLDGGGSTQAMMASGRKKLEVNGLWPVPDVLAAY